MSNFTPRQCDFAIGVTKTAMLEGLDRDRLLELIGTAWNVLNSEREPVCEHDGEMKTVNADGFCLVCGEEV